MKFITQKKEAIIMSYKYTRQEQQTVIERYITKGESVSVIVSDTGIPRSTIYAWIKQYLKTLSQKPQNLTLKHYQILENKVKRLEGIIKILQSVNCTANSPLDIKLYEMENLYGQYSVHMLCDALNVARGTFYNHILRNKRENVWYMKRREVLRTQIQRIYNDSNQIFGATKITAVLKSEGEKVSVKLIRKLMQDMGLFSIRQDAKDLYEKEQVKYKNILKQQFNTNRPNQVWVSDITYFRFNNSNYYICAIMDLFARKIVGYKISKSNSTQLAKSTLKSAYEKRTPKGDLIFHTDRGSNFRSKTFCAYLKSLEITQSYSRAYTPYDNSVMETFFSSLKREELYRTKYRSEREFRTAVDNYMIFYNEQRPHFYNGYKTPNVKEQEYFNKHKDLTE